MTTHDNIHIPTESFPHWIWFVIEFFIVLAVSALISREIMVAFQEYEEPLQNWIFFGIITAIFFVWGIIIRSIILKKPILRNRG